MSEFECSWDVTLPNPNLSDDDIHVWRANLDLPDNQVHRLIEYLAREERLRASRFHFIQHTRRYVVAHGFLRAILGHYLSLDPSHLVFSLGLHGKPALLPRRMGDMVLFNQSHSHELALFAIARNFAIGVDLEHIRSETDIESVAKCFLSPREFAEIRSLPRNERQEAFFKVWAIKEAFLKATGEGLGGLHHVEVCLTSGRPISFFRIQNAPQGVYDCSAHLLTPAEGYVGCVAVDGWDIDSYRLRSFEALALLE